MSVKKNSFWKYVYTVEQTNINWELSLGANFGDKNLSFSRNLFPKLGTRLITNSPNFAL